MQHSQSEEEPTEEELITEPNPIQTHIKPITKQQDAFYNSFFSNEKLNQIGDDNGTSEDEVTMDQTASVQTSSAEKTKPETTWQERRDKSRKNSKLSNKLKVSSTVWCPILKLYVVNPALVSLENQQKTNNQSSVKDPKIQIQEEQADQVKRYRRMYSQIVLWKNEKSDHHLHCDLCLNSISYPMNALVVCELCLTAVHQECYGREIKLQIPQSDWFCSRCLEIKTIGVKSPKKAKKSIKNEIPICCLCPDVMGIILRLTDGPFKSQWVHPVCVNWSSECSYLPVQDPHEQDYLTQITIKPNLDAYCCVCKRYEGATIGCDFGDCDQRMHVRCAINQKCIQERNLMELQVSKQDVGVVWIFCIEHHSEALNFIQIANQNQTGKTVKEQLKLVKLGDYINTSAKPEPKKIVLGFASIFNKPPTKEALENKRKEEETKRLDLDVKQKERQALDKIESGKQTEIRVNAILSNMDQMVTKAEKEEDILKAQDQLAAAVISADEEQIEEPSQTQSQPTKVQTPSKPSKKKRKKDKTPKPKQFALDKKKLIDKKLSEKKQKAGFKESINLPNKQMKNVSGMGMHLLVEQLLQNQRKDSTQSTSTSSPELVTPTKDGQSPDLVKISLPLQKSIGLPRTIWPVDDLMEKLVLKLKETNMLIIVEEEDGIPKECIVDLSKDKELTQLLLGDKGGSGFGFKCNTQDDVFKHIWALVSPHTALIS